MQLFDGLPETRNKLRICGNPDQKRFCWRLEAYLNVERGVKTGIGILKDVQDTAIHFDLKGSQQEQSFRLLLFCLF